jgi:hypothetical protein
MGGSAEKGLIGGILPDLRVVVKGDHKNRLSPFRDD